MGKSRWLVRILVSATVLIAPLLTALVLAPGSAASPIGIVPGSVTSEPYGTYGGIAYVKYSGRFVGLAGGDYSVPFEIIAPADPAQGNGITIIEPFRLAAMGGLEGYLTPEFLLGRGFSHAGIGWHPDEVVPDLGYSTPEAIEILYNFGIALREDDTARGMVGEVQMLYSTGVSLGSEPLLALLASPETAVLDFTFLFVPTLYQETYSQHQDSNNIMVFLTESDFVRSAVLGAHTDALRVRSATYRSYEVAGGPHIPDVPWIRALLGSLSEDTTPLDWTPVARALFLAGHRWTKWGIEPPPSVSLAETDEIDHVYEPDFGPNFVSGIARDENGNALGGIRLPDLEIGRGHYKAVDPESLLLLFGDWNDLQCELLPDGSARFRNHGAYVSQFVHHTQRLIAHEFLLQEDAARWIVEAARSDVGKRHACAP
jgi:hypothetical protein